MNVLKTLGAVVACFICAFILVFSVLAPDPFQDGCTNIFKPCDYGKKKVYAYQFNIKTD